MSAIDLMKQIQEVLSEYDSKVLQGLIDSIPVRRQALKDVSARKAAGEFKGQYSSIQYAHAQLAAVGGKGWRELLRNNDDYIIQNLTKSEAAKAEARAAKIASKLNKLEVKEVTKGEASRTSDGYTGWWKIETDQGTKHVKIEIIGAGGWNIQCYHYRVLCKVS